MLCSKLHCQKGSAGPGATRSRTSRPACDPVHAFGQSVIQLVNQSSVSPSVSLLDRQSVSQLINQSVRPSVSLLDRQSVSQSVN